MTKISTKKPTEFDVMLHQFLYFWKSTGINPDFDGKYHRRKQIK